MAISENYLLLEVRNVQEMERFAETNPFQCELWGQAPGEDWAKIAHVSNAGTGGGHVTMPFSKHHYARFRSAVHQLKAGPLDMTQYLDWALFRFFSYCEAQLGRALPQDAPLKNEFEVADQIVTALLDYQSFELKKYWVFPYRKIECQRFGRGPSPKKDREAIARDYPGETLINDLKPPALTLPQ